MLEADYRAVLSLSQQMYAATEIGDWNCVSKLNSERETLIASLPAMLPPLDEATGRRIADLIRATLDCDRRVRDRAEAWLNDASPLLEALSKKLPRNEAATQMP